MRDRYRNPWAPNRAQALGYDPYYEGTAYWERAHGEPCEWELDNRNTNAEAEAAGEVAPQAAAPEARDTASAMMEAAWEVPPQAAAPAAPEVAEQALAQPTQAPAAEQALEAAPSAEGPHH